MYLPAKSAYLDRNHEMKEVVLLLLVHDIIKHGVKFFFLKIEGVGA